MVQRLQFGFIPISQGIMVEFWNIVTIVGCREKEEERAENMKREQSMCLPWFWPS